MELKDSLLGVIIYLCLFSCTKDNAQVTTKDDYNFYQLEEKGWKSRSYVHYINGIEYKATLVPVEYYILKNTPVISLRSVDSIRELHGQERIIEMEFKHATNDDLFRQKFTTKNYAEAISYMAFNIENDFTILTNSLDTIPCLGAIFERNFKLAPFKRILLHFSGISEDEEVQLIYDDKLFGQGLMTFTFSEEPIVL